MPMQHENLQCSANRHSNNLFAFKGPNTEFNLILLILSMIIHKSFTGPTHFLSANVKRTGKFGCVCANTDILMKHFSKVETYF